MKQYLIILTILLFLISNIYSQEVESNNKKANKQQKADNINAPLALTDEIKIKNETGNAIITITDEGNNAGSIFFPSVGGLLTGSKLYSNGVNLFWGNSQLNGSNGATAINDLTDASYDGSSLFIGEGAGANNDGSTNGNTAVGSNALFSNTTGFSNSASGYQALYSNTTGFSNTANGYWALFNNTEGFDNLALGFKSLFSNISGFRNTSIGFDALNKNNTGSYNTASGYRALFSNTSGVKNVANGYAAGHNSAGDGNIFIGYLAGFNEIGSNKLYIENTSADANNALIYGEFDTNILRTNSEFQIGNPTLTGYAFPTADGTVNQVLQTDGSGSLSWNVSVKSINELMDGKSDVTSLFLGEGAGTNDDGTNNNNTAVGINTLSTNTIGEHNTAYGAHALRLNVSSNNTAFGSNAMDNNSNGTANTATGNESLNQNSSGNHNTANGYQALMFNITGNNNTANGYQALYSNTTDNNTANGYQALFSNTTGIFNTASGLQALYSNISGNNNTANGYTALYANTDGADNTASGFEALRFNDGGNSNSAYGYQTLGLNTSGNDNTATGNYALAFNSSGSQNTANGYKTLQSNNTGIRNTAIGTEALYSNTTGNYNTATGYKALYNSVAGHSNTAFGRQALYDLTSGTNNIGLGYDAQVPNSAGSNQIRIGDTQITYAGVQVAWSITSDKRWKEKIRDLPYGLDMVLQLNPVDYVRKNSNTKTREIGFIAQDVEELLTKIDYADQGFLTKDDNGHLNLRYNDFIALNTKAIQDQQEIIKKQGELIANLEKRIQELENN